MSQRKLRQRLHGPCRPFNPERSLVGVKLQENRFLIDLEQNRVGLGRMCEEFFVEVQSERLTKTQPLIARRWQLPANQNRFLHRRWLSNQRTKNRRFILPPSDRETHAAQKQRYYKPHDSYLCGYSSHAIPFFFSAVEPKPRSVSDCPVPPLGDWSSYTLGGEVREKPTGGSRPTPPRMGDAAVSSIRTIYW